MQNNRRTGAEYEAKTVEYLIQQGFVVLEQNFRCRIGEIDIIALDGEYLVFVEVKYRFRGSAGSPLEAVNRKKQKIISKVAQYYCMMHGFWDTKPCRFDVAAYEQDSLTYLKHAFEYIS